MWLTFQKFLWHLRKKSYSLWVPLQLLSVVQLNRLQNLLQQRLLRFLCPVLSSCHQSESPLKVGRKQLTLAQKADPSLTKCIAAVLPKDKIGASQVVYYWEDDILMRKWAPLAEEDSGCNTVHQVVVPVGYCAQILSLAHDDVLFGNLGISKTYYRILKYFFWPGLKSDVKYCQSCHVCQLIGKPNQVVPQAPLHPIPVIGEPFERLIIDCVGPLPKSKSGHQFLLTLMCAATRYPEAIPLHSLKAKVVVKELIKFCTTFGLPKVIQTDQGTNFMSKVFAQVLEMLAVKHQVSSAYHPESQGALERFHQTLKTMLRAYCLETGREWDEGIPFLLFAIRGTVQESLGFSPAELVFGHTVRGPLKLCEQLTGNSHPCQNVLDYVSSFRERLHHACALAKEALSSSQSKMKAHFDKTAIECRFNPRDSVFVFLPVL
uniref:Gypsy retrotransposon integrase-like protein 1 n=1 Tax=Sphaeramia orbicularis TaxID=375764 RepID=A0A673AE92_9TELE